MPNLAKKNYNQQKKIDYADDDWWSQALSVVNGAYARTKYNDKCCPSDPQKKKKKHNIHNKKQTNKQNDNKTEKWKKK